MVGGGQAACRPAQFPLSPLPRGTPPRPPQLKLETTAERAHVSSAGRGRGALG